MGVNLVTRVRNSYIQNRSFTASDHDVQDGCVTLGSHGLLRFDFLSDNAASADLVVGSHKYRLRLLNGSNARYYTFALSSGASITEIGNEAGLFSTPIAASSVTLPPAGRADVIVGFSKQAVGTSVVLKNKPQSGTHADLTRSCRSP